MPIRFSNRSGGNGALRIGGFKWVTERRTDAEMESHGVWLYTGPKGAGKSLLAHSHSYLLATGQFRDRFGNCICGEPECAGVWTVYTMHESPTLPEYGAWAKRLDLGELMDVGGEGETHIVIYIDEIPQYLNSRRGMVSEVIRLLNRVTFTRKGKIIFIGTGISIDWIDVRLRDQATMIYNCWTPNKGKTVWANVHRLALGHLPPHMRRQPPMTKWWPTEWAHRANHGNGIYNTDELVDAQADFTAARTEPIFYTKQGNLWIEKKFSEALAETIETVLMEDITRVTPELLIARIQARYGEAVNITPHWVKEWLQSIGFMRGNGQEFIIGSLLEEREDSDE